MNILFHGWEYPPNGAGVGAYMFNMAHALSAAGHHIVVVTGYDDGLQREEEQNGVYVYRNYSRNERGSLRVRDMVLQIASEHSIDWIEGADHLGDCAELLKVDCRPPIVIKVHTCNVLKVLRKSQVLYGWQRLFIHLAIWRKRTEYLAEKYCIEHADMLIAPSNRVVYEMRKQDLSISKSVDIIPNPIIPSKTFVNVESEKPTLLFIGRLDIGKGIQYLPKIMKSLNRQDVSLEIVGPDTYARGIGYLEKWLRKQFSECIGDVHFFGKLDATETAKAYQRAWVVIVPSRWDNFPTIVLESMCYAKPVVASPHGGMPEMLKGTLCSVADPSTPQFAHALRTLLEDKSFRKRAGKSMYEKFKSEYVPEIVACKYIETIKVGLSF